MGRAFSREDDKPARLPSSSLRTDSGGGASARTPQFLGKTINLSGKTSYRHRYSSARFPLSYKADMFSPMQPIFSATDQVHNYLSLGRVKSGVFNERPCRRSAPCGRSVKERIPQARNRRDGNQRDAFSRLPDRRHKADGLRCLGRGRILCCSSPARTSQICCSSRTASRGRELAVRTPLGASRGM